MMSQKKLLDKLKERIKIWNITFLATSIIIGIYLVMTRYLGWTTDTPIQTSITILLMMFSLPLGISMGLQIANNLVKQWKEDLMKKCNCGGYIKYKSYGKNGIQARCEVCGKVYHS